MTELYMTFLMDGRLVTVILIVGRILETVVYKVFDYCFASYLDEKATLFVEKEIGPDCWIGPMIFTRLECVRTKWFAEGNMNVTLGLGRTKIASLNQLKLHYLRESLRVMGSVAVVNRELSVYDSEGEKNDF